MFRICELLGGTDFLPSGLKGMSTDSKWRPNFKRKDRGLVTTNIATVGSPLWLAVYQHQQQFYTTKYPKSSIYTICSANTYIHTFFCCMIPVNALFPVFFVKFWKVWTLKERHAQALPFSPRERPRRSRGRAAPFKIWRFVHLQIIKVAKTEQKNGFKKMTWVHVHVIIHCLLLFVRIWFGLS